MTPERLEEILQYWWEVGRTKRKSAAGEFAEHCVPELLTEIDRLREAWHDLSRLVFDMYLMEHVSEERASRLLRIDCLEFRTRLQEHDPQWHVKEVAERAWGEGWEEKLAAALAKPLGTVSGPEGDEC